MHMSEDEDIQIETNVYVGDTSAKKEKKKCKRLAMSVSKQRRVRAN